MEFVASSNKYYHISSICIVTSIFLLCILYVIKQVCGQTLARVRFRADIDSSIIISLQWRKGT